MKEFKCPHCKGLGKVIYYHGDLDTCPTCHGAGYVAGDMKPPLPEPPAKVEP